MNRKKNSISLNIQFRHMPKSRSIKQLVRQQAERLNHFNLHNSHCEVVIDEMHHWHKGGVYKVTLRLTVPGDPLYVACAEEESGSYEFLYSAVRDVFEDIGLQIKKRRRKIGRHRNATLAA